MCAGVAGAARGAVPHRRPQRQRHLHRRARLPGRVPGGRTAQSADTRQHAQVRALAYMARWQLPACLFPCIPCLMNHLTNKLVWAKQC